MPGRPIVVRQFPGERATIDGSLGIQNGGYAWFWGLEVMYSDTRRFSNQTGSWPSDLPRSDKSVDIRAPGAKLINMIVHDIGGIGSWVGAVDSEIYGSVIYNNGWEAPDRAHGHGMYIQNAAGTKRIAHNIVFSNFSYGIQVYGASTATNNITLEGNVSFNNGILAQGGGHDLIVSSDARNFQASGNHFYRSDHKLTAVVGGPWSGNPGDARFTGNRFVGNVQLTNWRSMDFTGNEVVGGDDYLVHLRLGESQTNNSYRLSGQSYYRLGTRLPFFLNGTGYLPLATWQSLGFDGGSSYREGVPGGTQVQIQPNEYERGRANIIVYNWGGGGAVSVNLSGVLLSGMRYEVRHAQDFYAPPLISGTYSGGSVTIPIVRQNPAAPIGGSSNTPPVTGPEFNVFVVVPVGP
jgi:hypothetical protein